MSDMQLSNDPDAYWAIRVVSADAGIGYVGEVYHELAMTFEITDSAIEPIDGAWLNAKIYRSMTVYSTENAARDAAERRLRFLDLANLQG